VYRTLDSVAGANAFLWVVWNALEPIRGGSTDLPLIHSVRPCAVFSQLAEFLCMAWVTSPPV